MFRDDKIKWSRAFQEAFRLFGHEGTITIKESGIPNEWTIYHSNFDTPFVGYPSGDEMYSILTAHRKFVDLNGLQRVHFEWIIFDSTTMAPLYYSVYNVPEYQRIQIKSDDEFAKGEIIFANMARNNGLRCERLKEPYLESDVFYLNNLLANLT